MDQNKIKSLSPSENLLAGMIGGTLETFIQMPLISYKFNLQTGNKIPSNIFGFYRGIIPQISTVAPITAFQMSTNCSLNNLFFKSNDSDGKKIGIACLTGVISSIFYTIPKDFNSVHYNIGSVTKGYNLLDDSIHLLDGFFPVITPSINSATERLGDVYFDVDKFTYEIVALTQAQIDQTVTETAKDDFKNNLDGVFAYATTPDGLNEYAIKIGNDGKIVTVLIP